MTESGGVIEWLLIKTPGVAYFYDCKLSKKFTGEREIGV